jgi:hypothetical protein
VLTLVKYVGCLLDTEYQDPAHLYNHSTKKCMQFKSLTLLHYEHVKCAWKWLVWFYAVLLDLIP